MQGLKACRRRLAHGEKGLKVRNGAAMSFKIREPVTGRGLVIV